MNMGVFFSVLCLIKKKSRSALKFNVNVYVYNGTRQFFIMMLFPFVTEATLHSMAVIFLELPRNDKAKPSTFFLIRLVCSFMLVYIVFA